MRAATRSTSRARRSRTVLPDAAVRRTSGLYAFRREFLLRFAALPQTPLELAESLEQLRALEHGFRIRTVVTEHDSIGVDTPEDLERVRRLLGRRGARMRRHDSAD